jgi:hypothetical protein
VASVVDVVVLAVVVVVLAVVVVVEVTDDSFSGVRGSSRGTSGS